MSIRDVLLSPDWGTVPDWLAAVGTISAVVLALTVSRRDGRRLREERAEAKADRVAAAEERAEFRRQRDEERAEAKRKLAARVTLASEMASSGNLFESPAVRWRVHNGSDEPISMVVMVQRIIRNDGTISDDLEIAGRWQAIEAHGFAEVRRPDDPNRFHPEAEIQFTDGAGARWQRKSSGALRQLTEDDPESIQRLIVSPYSDDPPSYE